MRAKNAMNRERELRLIESATQQQQQHKQSSLCNSFETANSLDRLSMQITI